MTIGQWLLVAVSLAALVANLYIAAPRRKTVLDEIVMRDAVHHDVALAGVMRASVDERVRRYAQRRLRKGVWSLKWLHLIGIIGGAAATAAALLPPMQWRLSLLGALATAGNVVMLVAEQRRVRRTLGDRASIPQSVDWWLVELETASIVLARDSADLRAIGAALTRAEQADQALSRAVAAARARGEGWTAIANTLGVSRNAARARFGSDGSPSPS